MAVLHTHGKLAYVSFLFGGSGGGQVNITPYVKGFKDNNSGGVIDVSTFGAKYHQIVSGLIDGSISLMQFYADIVDNLFWQQVGNDTPGTLIWNPQGGAAASGLDSISMVVALTKHEISGPIAGAVEFSVDMKITATPTITAL